MAKAKADIGILSLDFCEFKEFEHYDLDQICDLGAVNITLIAEESGQFYEVTGEFAMGVGTGAYATALVEVHAVKEIALDDDGDIDVLYTTNVAGVHITVPVSTVLAVTSTLHDSELFEQQYTLVESILANQ